MFILAFVFICNTLVFLTILEERFKVIATLGIGFASFVISLIAKSTVLAYFPEPELYEPVACAVNLGILLIASVFFASNNILQKILLALILQFNFTFIALTLPEILNVTPFAVSGFMPLVAINGLYALSCLITAAVFWGPLHFFYRSPLNLSQLVLCLLQLLACVLCGGTLETILGVSSFALTFFASLFIYIVVVFCSRAIYSTTKDKIDDINSAADEHVMNVWADSFNAMLVSVNSNKILSRNMDNSLKRIFEVANSGDIQQVLDYAYHYKEIYEQNPLLGTYSENPYVNALIATKTSEAMKNDVNLSSKIDLEGNHVSLVTTCALIDHVLAIANEESSKSSREEKNVNLIAQAVGNFFVIESDFTMSKRAQKQQSLKINTLEDVLKLLLKDKNVIENSRMDNLITLVEKLDGTLNQTYASGQGVIKIMLPK